MFELIISVGCAVIISAACSLSEAVLYSVPLRHVEVLANSGSRVGYIFKELKENIDRPIGAILSLNTIANTAGAAFAGSAAYAVFGHENLVYFSIFFTLAILIFSEIVPKTAGVVYSRSLMPMIAYPLKGLVWIMAPAIWLSTAITGIIARKRMEEVVTADELRIMAHLSLKTGGIRPYQKEMIENILSLQDKMVKDVMTPRTVILSLSEHLTLEEVKGLETEWEHSRIPVYDKGKEDIVGIVLVKDIFIELAKGNKDMSLTQLMRPVHFVVEVARLNQVLMEFLELRQHMFIVLDEYGGLAGLITLEDILEEILGREIVDESDQVEDKRELARQRRKQLIEKWGNAI
ncbi:MAG: hypothetical protein DRG39_01325 [Deltaproteobacteria bacterium]|nr:MAG: hypothetical protein DRG39_01325 [Deltaproteobacteria bacterium]